MAIEKATECSRCGKEIHGGKTMLKLHMKRHSKKQED